MVKKKTSGKRKPLPKRTLGRSPKYRLKKGAEVKEYDPIKVVLDEKRVSRAIWECLTHDDPEGLIEVIENYLEAVNLSRFSKEADIPRATLYYTLKSKNPTVKTLTKLVSGCVMESPSRMQKRA